MTREEIMQLNSDYLNGCESEHKMNELFGYVLELQKHEQEPCEDTISRQAVEKITWEESSYIDPINALTEVREKIRALPSIAPQQKVGKWIRVDKDKLKCSECETIHFIAQYPQSANINYCPNCGCLMKGEGE